MGVRFIAAVAWLGLSLVGCGGSQLKPNQQREYDALTAEQAQIKKKQGQAKARADRAFRDLGAAEKKHRQVFKHAVLCGASAKGQSFGPFPWGGKRRARLDDAGSATVSGQRCAVYRLKVVK